jgi:hypothetical protein
MAFEWFTPEAKARLNHISKKGFERYEREQAREKAAKRDAVIVPFPPKPRQ